MLHGLRTISSRQLELGQADQRALRSPRGGELDDDALVVALGIGGCRRERRSPIERFHITWRAFRGRGELPRNDPAPFLTATLNDEPLRGNKCRVGDRAVRLLRTKRCERREREGKNC